MTKYKVTQEQHELISEIVKLVILLNEADEENWWFEATGHIQAIEIRNKSREYSECVYLDWEDSTETLSRIRYELDRLLNQIIREDVINE